MATRTNRGIRVLTVQDVANLLVARKDLPPRDAGDEEPYEPSPPPTLEPRTLDWLIESDPRTYDAQRAFVRDRYIGIRFEGVARHGADLADPARVIKAARLKFEEGNSDGALELLELAIEEDPYQEALWLAEIELAFLLRYKRRFVEAARAFRAAHPKSKAWSEIQRLGRTLVADDAMFAGSGSRPHEHYGPWPNLPNWINAPWDLTNDVLAADFHMAMTRKEKGDGD